MNAPVQEYYACMMRFPVHHLEDDAVHCSLTLSGWSILLHDTVGTWSVNERCSPVCCLVVQDFALDSDEQQLRTAAHHMVRNLTAGMVMITCREPLGVSIATNLRNNISSMLNIRSVRVVLVVVSMLVWLDV